MKKLECIPFYDTELTGGFFFEKQKLCRDVTLEALRKVYIDTGRFAAMKCDKASGVTPHIFYDSDVAKWMEGVAYFLEFQRDEKLEGYLEEIIGDIEKNMDEDGYYNSYFLTTGETRFADRGNHELYCAGHLFEAACAYYHATGRDKFLKLMCRYADHIYKVFITDAKSDWQVPGHPEIEIALIKLYKVTGDEKYLELSKYFVEKRGSRAFIHDHAMHDQNHDEIRQQNSPTGHAVRQLYLETAVTMLAKEYGDSSLYEVAERMFNSLSNMVYVTGGVGSSDVGEAFTIPFDLPNKTAYNETCASIALMMYLRGLNEIDPDARYADMLEYAMYNGMIAGFSEDGKRFFYTNPLEIDPSFAKRNVSAPAGWDNEYHPRTTRTGDLSCSCCPPNLCRVIPSVADYIYMHDNDTLYVNHYMASRTKTKIGEREASLSIDTEYPNDGKIVFSAKGAKGIKLALRIPDWCGSYTLGSDKYSETPNRGYHFVDIDSDDFSLTLTLEMKVRLIEANPAVREDCGRVAVSRGPVIFCLEGIDNGANLNDIMLDPDSDFAVSYSEDRSKVTISAKGYAREYKGKLYRTFDRNCLVGRELKFIPYSSYANRAETEMLVWTRVRY